MTDLNYDSENATVYEQHCFTIENMLQEMNDNERINSIRADAEFDTAFGNVWEAFYGFHNHGYRFLLSDLEQWQSTLLIPIINHADLLTDLQAIYSHMRDIAA